MFTGCVFFRPLTVGIAICTVCVETHTDNNPLVWLHFILTVRITHRDVYSNH